MNNAKKLVRRSDNRMLAGVCAGVADYLAVDVTLVRIVAALLSLASGVGVIAYLVGYALMPEDLTGRTALDDLSDQFGGRKDGTVPPPTNPTPGMPADPTPGMPANPTPGMPADPTPGMPGDTDFPNSDNLR